MNASDFVVSVKAHADAVPEEVLAFQNQLTLELRDEAVRRTPVFEGTLKRSWTAELAGKFGDSSHVRNGEPYAVAVEYGGYPWPVMRGTYIAGFPGHYEIRSYKHFSKQAPHGMLRPAVDAVLNRYGGS